MRLREIIACMTAPVMSLEATITLIAGTRFTEVTVDQARGLIQKHAGTAEFVILDVRRPEEFAEGHLSGAVDVHLMAPDFERRLGVLDRGKTSLALLSNGQPLGQGDPGHGPAGVPVGVPHVRGHCGLAEEGTPPVHVVVNPVPSGNYPRGGTRREVNSILVPLFSR